MPFANCPFEVVEDTLFYLPKSSSPSSNEKNCGFDKVIEITPGYIEKVLKSAPLNDTPISSNVTPLSVPEDYKVTDEGIFWCNKETGKFEHLCNFQLEPQKILKRVSGDCLQSTSIQFRIILCNEEHCLTLDIQKLDSLAKKVCDSFPTAIIYAECSKAEQKIGIFFRSRSRNLPTETVQRRVGWFSFQGRKIFAHDAHPPIPDVVMQTGKSILCDPQELHESRNTFLSVLKLGPYKITAPMVATALLGPLYPLFEEADSTFPPHFVLFINGTTGSLKTAVSRVLFNVYNTTTPYAPASFNDTETSLELYLQESPHSAVLVDDFYSTGLSTNRREMQSKLTHVIRFVGDGIGKNRSNAGLQNIKGSQPSGTVVITGEDTAGQMSTLLRCIILCVNHGTFNRDVLSLFQGNRLKWPSFIGAFIDFLESNYSQIVLYIRTAFPALRKHYQSEFSDLRPVDQLVQIILALRILEHFLQQSAPESPKIEEAVNSCIEACLMAVKESYEYISQNSAERLYAFSLAKLISEEEIVLADSHKTFSLYPQKFDGFMDKGYLYLKSDPVYSKVRQRFKQQGRDFPLSSLEVKRALYQANLSVVEIEKRGTADEKVHLEVKVKVQDKRTRMLKIDYAAFQAYTQIEN